MNIRDTRRYEMLVRVRDFGAAHADRFPPGDTEVRPSPPSRRRSPGCVGQDGETTRLDDLTRRLKSVMIDCPIVSR